MEVTTKIHGTRKVQTAYCVASSSDDLDASEDELFNNIVLPFFPSLLISSVFPHIESLLSSYLFSTLFLANTLFFFLVIDRFLLIS